MKTLYYEQCHGIYPDQILNDVNSQQVDRVVIFGETEWEIPVITKEFVQELLSKNIELRIVHGALKNDYYVALYEKLGLPIENVSFWGTHWINWSYQCLLGVDVRPESYVVDKDNFKHKFISLNNRSHFHRCVFIDEMAKQNLIDKGVVTWVKHLNENSNYPYKHFDNRQLLLDDEFIIKLDSFLLPKEYHESLVHVITECNSVVNCVSEKTANTMLLKKPFIVFGPIGFTQALVDLGFKLYDEVFDYSFDNVDDIYLRAEMFVANLHELEKYDMKILYETLYPKIKHNYDLAIKILLDKSYIPDVVLEYYEDNKTQGLGGKIHTFLNQKIKQLKLYSIWLDNKNYLDEIDSTTISEVIVDNTVETEYTQLQGDQEGLAKLIERCLMHNIPLTLLSASHRFNNILPQELADRIKIEDNSCFWLAKMLQAMLAPNNRVINEERGYEIFDDNVGLAEDVQHLYLSMNNLAKYHRCVMMDMLGKYDLIKHGAISWRDVNRHYDGMRPLPDNITESLVSGYDFKYWTPTKMYLDFDYDTTSYVNQNAIPTQLRHSFMQLVAETESHIFFMSEKTAVPLLMNKPFLVVGSKNFHKNLQELGFLLYDEIFDYSFDSVDDDNERTEQLVLNIDRLKHHTKDELQELTKLIRPKLLHNRKLALQYIKEVMTQYKPYLNKITNAGYQSQLGLIEILETYDNRL